MIMPKKLSLWLAAILGMGVFGGVTYLLLSEERVKVTSNEKTVERNPAGNQSLQTVNDAQRSVDEEMSAQKNSARFLTEINPIFEKRTTSEIGTVIVNADRSGDNKTFEIAVETLVRRAQLGETRAADEIASAIKAVSPARREFLVSALGKMATPRATEHLLAAAQASDPDLKKMRWAILGEIGNLGTHIYDNGEYPVEVVPVLIQQLDRSNSDPELFSAIAKGISTAGSAQGIEMLLEHLDSGNLSREQENGVAEALKEVINPDAVVPLSERIEQDPGLTNHVTVISGDALAAMSDPKATEALLAWASAVEGPSMRNQALTWLGEVRDEQSMQLLMEAGVRYSFRDIDMKKEIVDLGQQLNRRATPWVE